MLRPQLPGRVFRTGSQDANGAATELRVELVYRLPGPFSPLTVQLAPQGWLLHCLRQQLRARNLLQGVIGAEDLNVFALDEVSNLEDGITHLHTEIFYLSVMWNGRRTVIVHGFDHHTCEPPSRGMSAQF